MPPPPASRAAASSTSASRRVEKIRTPRVKAADGGGGKPKKRKKREKLVQSTSPNQTGASSSAPVQATPAAPQPALIVSFEDPKRLAIDALVLAPEIDSAKRRLDTCDDALHMQHEELKASHEQLTKSTSTQGELREAKVRAEQHVLELRLVLEYQEAATRAAAAAARDFAHAYAVSEDELRAAEAKIHEHRAAEARAVGERRRVWERSMQQWLAIVATKRIDTAAAGAEADVFAKLRQLLVTEGRERQAQAAYLTHAAAAELDADVARLEARCMWLEGQSVALEEEHINFGQQLTSNLTGHLKSELEISNARVVALEREVHAVEARLASLDADVDERGAARGAALEASVPPLLEQAKKLDAEISRRLDALPVDHPAALLARQKALVAESEEAARRERAEADRLEGLLKAERAAHEITACGLDKKVAEMGVLGHEFELKATFEREMRELDGESAARESEHAEKIAVHERALGAQQAAVDVLTLEVTDLRKQRQKMALSLAQYATLEYENGEKVAAREVSVAKLEKANRRLRKPARRADELATLVAESSHDDVVRLRGECEQLQHRLDLARTHLSEAQSEREEARSSIEDKRSDNAVAEWEMKEKYAQREEAIAAQAQRYKEHLGRGVVKRWRLLTAAKCFRAWGSIYVMTRKMRRDLGARDDSDDEGEGGGVFGGPPLALAQHAMSAISSHVSSQVSLQVSQVSHFSAQVVGGLRQGPK